jgi:membrane-bound lytic murein transglycosylase D
MHHNCDTKKGDNLGMIAKKYEVTVAEIQEWNHLSSNNVQIELRCKLPKMS